MTFDEWWSSLDLDGYPPKYIAGLAWKEALGQACKAIHDLRASHVADAPTCDYVSCDFITAWDDAIDVLRAMANGADE